MDRTPSCDCWYFLMFLDMFLLVAQTQSAGGVPSQSRCLGGPFVKLCLMTFDNDS